MYKQNKATPGLDPCNPSPNYLDLKHGFEAINIFGQI